MSWFRRWRRARVLKHASIDPHLWHVTVARYPFTRVLTEAELERLRELVILFLHEKGIHGAAGMAVREETRLAIAVQACILILNLGLDYYRGWAEVIVYPDEFVAEYDYVDEAGVAHHVQEPMSGESWQHGPVIISWADVQEAGYGYNVVIHEFAHKLDMLNGEPNGFPPLHADMSRDAWAQAFTRAYDDFCRKVKERVPSRIDEYAAENPAEFFAVLSEAFFEAPASVNTAYPAVYAQLAQFYRQDPAARSGRQGSTGRRRDPREDQRAQDGLRGGSFARPAGGAAACADRQAGRARLGMSASTRLVLGADIGGTNTKLALAAASGADTPRVLELKTYASRDYDTLERAVETFLRDAKTDDSRTIAAACFAVAGPVENGRATLTNLPWRPEESTLRRHFGIARVSIVNDFAAAGMGIAHLAPSDLLTLQHGEPDGPDDRVVIGAGTGLGVALVDWDGTRYVVHPSEAGHSDFAPTEAVQDELLAYLRREFTHVSWERVLSGAGICRILSFLEASGAVAASKALKDAMSEGDPARAITEFALADRDELAARALDVFVSAYGSFAGNMALAMLAHGGVYVAGGIAPKIAAKLTDGAFIRTFVAKGRFRPLLESIPVHVVMNEHVGVLGALAEAARISQ